MGQGNRWQLNRWIASCWLPHFKIAFGISHFNNIRWGSAVLLLQCQDFQLRTVAHLLTPCFEKFPLRLSSGRELGWKTCFLIFYISHRDIRGCRNHQPVFWMQYMRSHFQMLSHGGANFKFKWYSVQRIHVFPYVLITTILRFTFHKGDVSTSAKCTWWLRTSLKSLTGLMT